MVIRKRALKVGMGVLGCLCLTAGIATAARSSSAATFKVDHQLCYTAVGKFKIPLTATGAPAVRLKNQFSPGGFVPLIKPALAFHCNPVTKTVQTASGPKAYTVTNPAAHLACLPMTPQKQQPTKKVVVTNQFGSATLLTQQPNLFCLPSWTSLTGPPLKTPKTPPGLSHFTCYPVSVASGAYTPPAVSLQDQFSANPVAATVNPASKELCVPTEKLVGARDYKILDPATSLLCFNVTATPIKPKVWDENQFGTSAVIIRATKWLCVPSTVQLPPPVGHLYWVDFGAGTVNKVSLNGGSMTTLASGQNHPLSVAVDGTSVYWTNSWDGVHDTVNKVPIGGGSVTTLASGQSHPFSVAVDGTNVYWVNRGEGLDGTVRKIPLAGGSVTTLASAQSNPHAVAVDGTYVYWVNWGFTADGTVNKVPIGGGSVTTLASGQSTPSWVAVDGTRVYWVNNAYAGSVNAAPLAGGSVTTLASGQHYPSSVAVDGTSVYWTSTFNGAVYKAPLGGGSVTALASSQNGPTSVKVDGTHVYWANTSDTLVSKVPLGGGAVTILASGQQPYSVAVGP